MKREGRQHGVVSSHAILPDPLSHKRYIKTVDPTLITGLFTKVSRKPTNQSKFTGTCGLARCIVCNVRPGTKSKGKAKGTMKLRSRESDHGLISKPDGKSATSALAYVSNDESYDEGDQYDYDYDYSSCEVEDKDEFMSYCDVGLGWGEGDSDDEFDGWYLVGHNSM